MTELDRDAYNRLLLEFCGTMVYALFTKAPNLEYRGNGDLHASAVSKKIAWEDGLRCRVFVAMHTTMHALVYVLGSAHKIDVTGQPWIKRMGIDPPL